VRRAHATKDEDSDSGTGKTGDVLLSTTGASANDNYTLTLVMTKHYAA